MQEQRSTLCHMLLTRECTLSNGLLLMLCVFTESIQSGLNVTAFPSCFHLTVSKLCLLFLSFSLSLFAEVGKFWLNYFLEKSTPKPKNYHWKPNVGPKRTTSEFGSPQSNGRAGADRHCAPEMIKLFRLTFDDGKWIHRFVSLNNNSITINY